MEEEKRGCPAFGFAGDFLVLAAPKVVFVFVFLFLRGFLSQSKGFGV